MGTVATPGGEAVEKLSKIKQEHMSTVEYVQRASDDTYLSD